MSKEILREVFGEGLTQSINGFNERYSATLGSSQQAVERLGRDIALATMCGTKKESGKLQVSTYVDGGKGSGDVCLAQGGNPTASDALRPSFDQIDTPPSTTGIFDLLS